MTTTGVVTPRLVTGRIVIGPKTDPGRYGPYERFWVTLNPDATRTLRAVTRSPRGDLIRDVNQQDGADWRPIEGLGRLYYGGQLQGTVLRRVLGDRLHSYAWRPGEPMNVAEFEAPPGMTLGFHPIVHEAWKMNFYDLGRGGLQDVLVFTVSNSWNGSSLGHGQLLRTQAEFLGRETVKVPAGEFDCDRFRWFTAFGDELHIWRTGELNLLARLEVVQRDVLYQLADLSEELLSPET